MTMTGLVEVERVNLRSEGYTFGSKAYINVDKIVYMQPCKISTACGADEIMVIHLMDNSTMNVSKESGQHLISRLPTIY